ncbi:MAG: fumarylacetoacetase [Phycisphaerales bacterium]|nr:fumarylacetoacetase [Phycisphaerales bacterium]MCI0631812.1 fumarylacetoacetase [Phycisphaerales bacterium]
MPDLSDTHDPHRQSWVESAISPKSDFPIQNLPFGVFRTSANERPRIGIAIGNQILDLSAALTAGFLVELGSDEKLALQATNLEHLMPLGKSARRMIRHVVSDLLNADNRKLRTDRALQRRLIVSMADARMLLPAIIGDYTDFYASIHHATNVGSMFRPDNPLLPNYKHLPVGYHGRASSIIPSGTPVRRPMGQTTATDTGPPTFGPSKLLDYEMELGFFIGCGNLLGTRIQMKDAPDHIFGMVIVNDWSARDIQKWEYQPLGPFNAKNFATTISPWVVTMDALEPYRIPGPPRSATDPPPLDYLKPVADMAFDITVEVRLASQLMRQRKIEPVLISRGTFADMYWTISQMLVHHTSTGCNLRPGDLIASGTISNTTEDSRGCLLERTWRGSNPITLPDGAQRKFLQDGDEVIMTAYCQSTGRPRIGFGECRGIITPAK